MELDTDLKPLDRGLKDAEARVALAVGTMQAMLDKLHANVDVEAGRLAELAAANAAMAKAGNVVTPAAATHQQSVTDVHAGGMWGIRGPQRAGSLTNPIVTVMEAAKYVPMGSMAAAIGESNVADSQGDNNTSGLATAAQIAGLADAVQELARNTSAASQLAQQGGGGGVANPNGDGPVVVALPDSEATALQRTADAVERLAMRDASSSSQGHTIVVDNPGGPSAPSRTIIAGTSSKSTFVSPQGENTVRIDGPQYAGLISAIIESGGKKTVAGTPSATRTIIVDEPAPGGSGGGAPPIIAPPSGGGGGGGRGPWWLPRLPGGAAAGPLGTAGLGTGALGFAGAGTAASFAGLGLEHFLLTALGVAGSGAAAVGGGGLLAAGSLGKIAVGGGSDLAVMKSTIADTQTLYTSLTAVTKAQQGLAPAQKLFADQVHRVADPAVTSAYDKLSTDLTKFGANSHQVATDQTNLAAAVKGVANPELTKTFSSFTTAVTGLGTATQGVNTQMVALGNTAGVKAEAGLAKAAVALNNFWDSQTSAARVQAVGIFSQAIQTAYTFVPLIAQAAERNLAMINTGLRPLFSWLRGPEGIMIFNDLENKFAHDLPFAIHAFSQGAEVLLRVVDIASSHTGGLVQWLDRLTTRLNSMDNAQLGSGITRLIDDFHLWGNMIKLLGEDIYGLFHQDVGTGNSLVKMLTGVLEKVHAYEQSTRGQAQIRNIFEIHKQEIQDILHIIGELAAAFGGIYLSIAPQLVGVMNNLVLPALGAVAKVLETIANVSPVTGSILGLLLISSKAFGFGTTIGALKTIFGLVKGIGAAEAGTAVVSAGSGVAASGAAKAAATLAGAGTVEAAAGGAGAAAAGGLSISAIAAGATAALPLVLAGGGVIAAVAAVNHLIGPTGEAHATVGKITGVSADTPREGFGRFGPTGPAPNMGGLAHQTLDIKNMGVVSKDTVPQLKALIAAMKEAGSIRVDGIPQVKKDTLQLAEAALHTKEVWNKSFDQVYNATHNFALGTGNVLSALKDRFATNMRLIAHDMGTNSDQGRKAVADNISKMVSLLTLNMQEGRVSVSQGMTEIQSVLKTGMQDGAIKWGTQWTDMFRTVTGLYQDHKINTKTYFSDLHSITSTGLERIKSETEQSLKDTMANLKQQYADGLITKQQYDTDVHNAQTGANATQAKDLGIFAGHVVGAMIAAGTASAKGVDGVINPLNKALKALGAKPLSEIGVVIAGAGIASAATGAAAAQGPIALAGGGAFQIGQAGAAGRDTIPMTVGGHNIMVGSGEVAAVFNRHQMPVLNQRLAKDGGLTGFFQKHDQPHYMAGGGVVGQVDSFMSHAGFDKIAIAGMLGNAVQESGLDPNEPGGGMWQQISNFGSGSGGSLLHQMQVMLPQIQSLKAALNAAKSPGAAATIFMDEFERPDLALANLPRRIAAANQAFAGTLGGPLSNSVGGGPVPTLHAPKVTGSGALADIDRAGLSLFAKAANSKLNALSIAQAALAGSGGGGGGVTTLTDFKGKPYGPIPPPMSSDYRSPPSQGPQGIGQFDGMPVAEWIIPMLSYGRAHGWAGEITSGFRPGNDPGTSTGGPGEHAGTQYPHGAVDFGGPGPLSSSSGQNRAAFFRAANSFMGYQIIPEQFPPYGQYPQGDAGHASGTGHASGGIVTMYDGTADEVGSIPKTAQAVASYIGGYGGYSMLPHLFPHAAHLSISGQQGAVPPGVNFSDIETGVGGTAHTVTETVPWMKAEIAAGRKPGAYGGTEQAPDFNLNTLVSDMSAAGIARSKYNLWLAHWGLPASVPAGFDALQYAGNVNGKYDVSVAKVGMFPGGVPGMPASKVPANMPAKSKPAPKIPRNKLIYGNEPAALAAATPGDGDITTINSALRHLNSVLAPTQPGSTLTGEINVLEDQNSTDFGSATFVVTQDALGNPVTPYVDETVVAGDATQLKQLIVWDTQIESAYGNALKLLPQLAKQINAAIKKRQTEIAARQAKIRANLAKIEKLRLARLKTDPALVKLRTQINSARANDQGTVALRDALSNAEAITVPRGKVGDSKRAAKSKLVASLQAKVRSAQQGHKVKVNDLVNDLARAEGADQTQKATWESDILTMEDENAKWGGTKTTVGTGGEIGGFTSKIKPLQADLATVQGYEPGGSNMLAGRFEADPNYPVGGIEQTIAGLQTQLAAISPSSLAAALAAADAAAAPAASSTTSQIDALKDQEIQQLAQQNQVLAAQYNVLADLPDFAGTFHTGGVIPGPTGAERMALVQAGETILPIGGGGDTHVHVNIANGMGWLAKYVDTRVQQGMRTSARQAIRGLPSRGGGALTAAGR